MRVDTIPEIRRSSTAEWILLVENIWDSLAADAGHGPLPRQATCCPSQS